jgi:hypothetical protein
MSQMKPNKTLISPTQFQGFVKLGNTPSNRPERTGEELPADKRGLGSRDHRAIIASELKNHPKKVGFSTVMTGLKSMGVEPNDTNLAHISSLVRNDNGKFHELVGLARKNAFGQKQRVAEKKKGFQSMPNGSKKKPTTPT